MAEETSNPTTKQTVLMAVGRDHPGILDAIAEHLSAQGGYVEEMKVCRLRGLIVLFFLVICDEETLDRVKGGAPYLSERTGMEITFHDAGDPSEDARPMRLVADGPAGAQLLKEVGNLTRVLNINITDASTESTNPGRQRIDLTLDLPTDLAVEKLHELLGQLFQYHEASWELVTV